MGGTISTEPPSRESLEELSRDSAFGRKELLQLLTKLSQQKSQKISKKAFVTCCHDAYLATPRYREQLFDYFDDHSGHVYVQEFAVFAGLTAGESHQEMLSLAMKVVDRDENGLSLKELQRMFVMAAMATKRANYNLPGMNGPDGNGLGGAPDFVLPRKEKKTIHGLAQRFFQDNSKDKERISKTQLLSAEKPDVVEDVLDYFMYISHALPRSVEGNQRVVSQSVGEIPKRKRSAKSGGKQSGEGKANGRANGAAPGSVSSEGAGDRDAERKRSKKTGATPDRASTPKKRSTKGRNEDSTISSTDRPRDKKSPRRPSPKRSSKGKRADRAEESTTLTTDSEPRRRVRRSPSGKRSTKRQSSDSRSPARKRSRSPARERSKSPARSPARRSRSPARRDRSPARAARSRSPARSPARRERSPARRSRSPARRSPRPSPAGRRSPKSPKAIVVQKMNGEKRKGVLVEGKDGNDKILLVEESEMEPRREEPVGKKAAQGGDTTESASDVPEKKNAKKGSKKGVGTNSKSSSKRKAHPSNSSYEYTYNTPPASEDDVPVNGSKKPSAKSKRRRRMRVRRRRQSRSSRPSSSRRLSSSAPRLNGDARRPEYRRDNPDVLPPPRRYPPPGPAPDQWNSEGDWQRSVPSAQRTDPYRDAPASPYDASRPSYPPAFPPSYPANYGSGYPQPVAESPRRSRKERSPQPQVIVVQTAPAKSASPSSSSYTESESASPAPIIVKMPRRKDSRKSDTRRSYSRGSMSRRFDASRSRSRSRGSRGSRGSRPSSSRNRTRVRTRVPLIAATPVTSPASPATYQQRREYDLGSGPTGPPNTSWSQPASYRPRPTRSYPAQPRSILATSPRTPR